VGRELALGVALDGDRILAEPLEDAVVHADVDAGVVAGVLRPIDDANLTISKLLLRIDEDAQTSFVRFGADRVAFDDELAPAGLLPLGRDFAVLDQRQRAPLGGA